MNRSDFFKLCRECKNDKTVIRQRLYDYFSDNDEALKKAPPCLLYDSDAKGKESTVELAVELLLREVGTDGKDKS